MDISYYLRNYPIDVYLMWLIIFLTVIVIFIYIVLSCFDQYESYQFLRQL
jgi:hypothetical protein